MSWAVNATTSNGAIDLTPLAATLRASDRISFFPSSSTPIDPSMLVDVTSNDSTQTETQPLESTRSNASSVYTSKSLPQSQRASARGIKPTASSLSSSSSRPPSAIVKSKGANGAGSSTTAGAAADASAIDAPSSLTLHAQECLKAEVASLRRDLAHVETKLLSKENALTKLSEALHQMEQEKLRDRSQSRSIIKDLKKSIIEGESRLAFFQLDAHQRKENEIAQIQKDNSFLIEQQNAILESVGETIKRSSSSLVDSSNLTHHPNFNGSSLGLNHEEYLKLVFEKFSQQRFESDHKRNEELKSLKLEHKDELEKLKIDFKKWKTQYVQQYHVWKKQYGSLMCELDYLTEYVMKLTYLFEEIDRGRYPIGIKHGITTFHVPSEKRAFLKYDPSSKEEQSSKRRCSMLEEKLKRLKMTFKKAKIPWEPELLYTNQSFLEDEKQRQVRRLKGENDDRVTTSGEEEEEKEQDGTPLLLESSLPTTDDESDSNPARHTRLNVKTLEETQSFAPSTLVPPTSSGSPQSSSNLFHTNAAAATVAATFEDELSSHPTIQYIKQIEEERDRYKYQLGVETRKKLELHHTLTSQNRLIQGNELFKRSKLENDRRNSMSSGGSGSLFGSNTSSMVQLLNSVGPIASAAVSPTIPTRSIHGGSTKLNHSSSSAATKAREIIQASGTVALNTNAGKLGINIGFNTSLSSAANTSAVVVDGGSSSIGDVGVTRGEPFDVMNSSGSMSMLTTPSRLIQHSETNHTNGAYKNVNLRPASAQLPTKQYDASRPMSAVSAATTSYAVSGNGSYPSSSANSRPTSAVLTSSSTRHVSHHQAYPVSVSVSPSQFARPIPMHIAHGNASATLLAHQLARNVLGHMHATGSGESSEVNTASSTQRSRPPSASPPTTKPTRAASAGRNIRQ